jgi:hypothetical protein
LLESIDVLVADGLNAQMRAKDIAGVLAVADAVSEQLSRLAGVVFWDLPRDDLTKKPGDPTSATWAMWRAWTILMGVPGIDVARCHKILHHKLPSVFPLLDNETIKVLGWKEPWATIYDDLQETSAAWERLEGEVAEVLQLEDSPRLTRLRLHDILLWATVTKRWDTALGHGQKHLRA